MGNRQHKQHSQHCTFCEIRDQLKQEIILYEDDQIMAFEDIDISSSQRHILICPKRHIRNINLLVPSDYEMVKQLEVIGRQILNSSHPGKQFRFGYHAPPFNSIDHIHLHGFVLPLTNCKKNLFIYGWNLTRNQDVLNRLQKEQKKIEMIDKNN